MRRRIRNLPHVIPLAVGFAVAHEARAALVEELPALLALEARRMPLEIGRHAQNVLVVVLGAAADAQREALLFCAREGDGKCVVSLLVLSFGTESQRSIFLIAIL